MGLLIWLAIGFVAGAIAKGITPQKEDPGWLSSIIVGVAGSMLGGFLAGLFGLRTLLGHGIIGDLIVATVGAVLFLYIYHKYLSDKFKLPI
jgi:uncharacterized membrane protein YeaQ/YmgE (transglycosylase-associated protein family)